jgi:hypothetical protein
MKILNLIISFLPIFLLLFSLAAYNLASPTITYAQTVEDIFGQVEEPEAIKGIEGETPGERIGKVISNVLRIILIAGSLAVMLMLVWGAFQWITSGGDKEGLAKAKARIIQAIIGLTILALSGVILTVLGQILGISFFTLPS